MRAPDQAPSGNPSLRASWRTCTSWNDTEPEAEARMPRASQSSWNTTPGLVEGTITNPYRAPPVPAAYDTATLRMVACGAIVANALRPLTTQPPSMPTAVVAGRVRSCGDGSLAAAAKM